MANVIELGDGRKAWIITADDAIGTCPTCKARAIVALPAHLLAIQPDDTTMVCHPGLGGCNGGFAPDCACWPRPCALSLAGGVR